VSRSTPTKFPRCSASSRLKTVGYVKMVIRKVALETAVTDSSTSVPSAKAGGLIASVTAIEVVAIESFGGALYLELVRDGRFACIGLKIREVLTVWRSCCTYVD